MDELEKLKRAKLYIDKLANGIDPISDEMLLDDTILNNIRLARCFFYVSNVLQQVIDNGGTDRLQSKTYRKKFFITEEQKDLIEITTVECYMKDLIDKINTVTDINNCRKFQQKWLSSWLIDRGILTEYIDNTNTKHKKASPEGEKLGFRTEMRNGMYGVYPAILINKYAQKYIIDNLFEMVPDSYSSNLNRAEYQGKPWSAEHESILVDLFNKQVPVNEIAITLKRTEEGIKARLKKLGIIEERSEAR